MTSLRMGRRYGYLRAVLKSEQHRLRALEPSDVATLVSWENNSDEWWMGAATAPVSKASVQQFVEGNQDIYAQRQLRWMLDAQIDGGWTSVGAMDLYDFDPRQRRAGVAVHIDSLHRRQGHALAGVALMKAYASRHLHLHQLYAEIPGGHQGSLALFAQSDFVEVSHRKQWVLQPNGEWSDVVTAQCIFSTPRP